MTKISILIILAFSFFNCKSEKEINVEKEYPRWIGDIKQDSLFDSPDFEICNDKIYQYFNFSDGPQFIGEKPSVLKVFKNSIYQRKKNV